MLAVQMLGVYYKPCSCRPVKTMILVVVDANDDLAQPFQDCFSLRVFTSTHLQKKRMLMYVFRSCNFVNMRVDFRKGKLSYESPMHMFGLGA